jgi:type I restriction enzyme S subunit
MDDDLFINGIQAANETYNACRDNAGPYETQLRSFMRSLWREYRPFADSNFRQHMLVDLDARFWEMYLACTLLENSLPLLRRTEGPDISIKHDVGRIWVEAVAPTSGADSNPDRVPSMKPGIATIIPEEKIILRLRAAIREKYDSKYHDYVNKGLVKPTDPYVIAINSCKIGPAIMETDTPRILQAVFPIGNWQVTIDRKTGIAIDTGHQIRSRIRRAGGAEVRTDVFLDPEYSNLSGVVYSHTSVRAYPFAKRMGQDFIFIHNPLAINKLRHGFLKVGREYVATENDDEYALNATNWTRDCS